MDLSNMKITKNITGGTLPGRYFTVYDVTSCLKLQRKKKTLGKKIGYVVCVINCKIFLGT